LLLLPGETAVLKPDAEGAERLGAVIHNANQIRPFPTRENNRYGTL
jgi:hypothetical protein